MKATPIKQKPKSLLTAILTFILRKRGNGQTKECINMDTVQPSPELYNQYLEFYKSNPNSSIRSRANSLRITKYRSEILTTKVKKDLKNERDLS